MDSIKAFIGRQPIATLGASITTLVVAAIGVANAFAPGTVSDAQIEDIKGALVAMWAALALVWPLVTPSGAPKVKAGTVVEVVTPGDAPNQSVTL